MATSRTNTTPINVVFDIRHFGASGDGKELDSPAIQIAIDSAHAAGGGTVYCPPGRYICGSIQLKSNVTLHLEANCRIIASAELDRYLPIARMRKLIGGHLAQGEDTGIPGALIYAENAENLAIVGRGTIEGRGRLFTEPIDEPWIPEWVPNWWEIPAYHFKYKPRPLVLVGFFDCQNVRVEDITTLDSFCLNIAFFLCDSLLVRGIRIRQDFKIPNADGIGLFSSSNVRISDCDLVTADDAICLKNCYLPNPEDQHLRRPCRNVVVTNCTISTSCTAIKCGTDSEDGFENIAVSNCSIYNLTPENRIACATSGIALESVDGGALRGITISNITMENVRTPLFLRLGNRGRGQPTPTPGVLEDVLIENLVARNAFITSSITGVPQHDVRGVKLSNVHIEMAGGGTGDLANYTPPERPACYPEAPMFGQLPSYGLYCRHVDGLTLRDVDFRYRNTDERPALICDDVKHSHLDHVSTVDTPGSQPEIKLIDCHRVFVRNCQSPVTDLFLQIDGERTRHVVVMGNDLWSAKKGIELSDNVVPNEVVRAHNVFNPDEDLADSTKEGLSTDGRQCSRTSSDRD